MRYLVDRKDAVDKALFGKNFEVLIALHMLLKAYKMNHRLVNEK